MTSQSHFQGMEPAAAGQLHEQTFNIALAQALRTRRKAWRDSEQAIIYEKTGVLAAAADRPDILAQTPEIYPVVLEVEFGDPAFGDARSRLGKRVRGTTFPIRSAIAIGAPVEIRNWSNDRLEAWLADPYGVELKYAILSANIKGDEKGEVTLTDADIHYWPRRPGFVTGNLEDLAVLCEYAAAPPQLVTDTAKRVAADITDYAIALQNVLDPATAKEIAEGLGQTDPRQGLRMACCIWLTSLRLQNRLAQTSSNLQAKGLQSISEMKARYSVGSVITPDELRAEWLKILDENYGAIFTTARKALHPRIPADVGSDVLTSLSTLADNITALRLGNRVDFAGELFPELLSDREETAAHYTLPETAELLSQLAVARIELGDWGDADTVASLKIADLACGTGSLLRAAYRHIRSRHDAAGGTGDGLHKRMMEESVVGLDINSLASHMTAAGLSAMEMETPYHDTKIAAVPVPGGKTGSLELLVSEQITDVIGQLAQPATANQPEPVNIEVPDESRDLVIQNPPYLRARGGRKMFDIAGIAEPERVLSERRLANIRSTLRRQGNEIPNGQAGLGTDFSALADQKLKPGGVFATVLPLTAAHADSWAGFRKTLEAEYSDITAIAFTPDEGGMLSADTHMNEMLVIASKGYGVTPLERIFCINLNDTPESIAESYWYAKLLNGIGQHNQGGDVIYAIGKPLGTWVAARVPSPGFPWFVVGMKNHHLARTAAELLDGKFYSPQDRQIWDLSLGFTTLREITTVGPGQDSIGYIRGGDARGVFIFDPITFGETPTYPSMWAAVGQVKKTILTGPTHEGHPVANQDARQAEMLAGKADLFISKTLRTTSQALMAARTAEPAMGGRAWNALQTDDDGVKDALAIWLNSSLGGIIRTCYAQTTQTGRATMQTGGVEGFPVPNFAADTPAGQQARQLAQERYGELADLTLEPVSYAFRDENRHKVDAAALELVGLGGNAEAARALVHLRSIWCREPAVHGGNEAIMKALGLRV